jgi:ribosomal protein S17E
MFDMFEKFCCRNEIGGYVKEKVKKGKEKKEG